MSPSLFNSQQNYFHSKINMQISERLFSHIRTQNMELFTDKSKYCTIQEAFRKIIKTSFIFFL